MIVTVIKMEIIVVAFKYIVLRSIDLSLVVDLVHVAGKRLVTSTVSGEICIGHARVMTDNDNGCWWWFW